METDIIDFAQKPLELSECKELRDFATYYEVSLSALKRLRQLGVDIRNEGEVNYLKNRRNQARLLVDYRESLNKGSADRPPTPGDAQTSLKESLQALREADAILQAEFKASEPGKRSKALGEWLKVQEARLKAEEKVFEVERLASNTLPIDEVKAEWFNLLKSYRDTLESIPAKWAPFLFEKPQWEIEEILKKQVSELVARHLTVT